MRAQDTSQAATDLEWARSSLRRLVLAAAVAMFVPATALAGGPPLAVDDHWRGTWEVTVTYQDPLDGETVATDVTSTLLCPGQPIAPPLAERLLHCSGAVDGDLLDLSCHAKHSPRPGCNVLAEATLRSNRQGDAWAGSGEWRVRSEGNCPHQERGERLVLEARRLTAAASCPATSRGPLGRIFQRLAIVPFLLR